MPYELPNLTAYNETCAAVANVFFNQGLFLGSGDAKFWDIAELSLFNNALAGINLKGLGVHVALLIYLVSFCKFRDICMLIVKIISILLFMVEAGQRFL